MTATMSESIVELVMMRPATKDSITASAQISRAAITSAQHRNRRLARTAMGEPQVYCKNQRAVGCGRYLLLAANAVHVPGGIGERDGIVHH